MEKTELEAKPELDPRYRLAMKILIIAVVGAVSFVAGLAVSESAHAAQASGAKQPRVIYPSKTSLDFEGAAIEGELRNPGEFYFQHRPEEKMNSLVKRRRNFHRELLRDAVLSK